MNNDVNTKHDNEKVYFFDKEENVTLVLRIFYALCVLLFLLDFVVHRHIYIWFENIPTFYALYGFVACVVLVLIATQMRKWLMRDEDYYQKTKPADNNTDEGGQ